MASWIVEAPNVVEELSPRLVLGLETDTMNGFGFERVKKLSIAALARQLPRRLMLTWIPRLAKDFW